MIAPLNGRRITALLLTAFLVAELMIRLQTGPVLPAASPDVWKEVAQGSYRATTGSYLVPLGAGSVLQRTAAGTGPAHPTYRMGFSGANIALYGEGASSVAVATSTQGQRILPRYGSGFLFVDARQNLWLVSRQGAQLLVGGGVGSESRGAVQAQIEAQQASGTLAKDWQLIWVVDPVAVGQSIWYLSNRSLPLGAPGASVWQLTTQGSQPLANFAELGITGLVGASPRAVLAENRQGQLLVIDPSTYAVRATLPGTDALAVGAGGEALLLSAAPGAPPKLLLFGGAASTPKDLPLPSGAQVLGPASFSGNGQWLAMLVQRDGRTLVYVVRTKGLGAGQQGDLLAPPEGVQVAPWAAPSFASGRVYLVVRSGNQTETWERSIGDGQAALGLGGLG